MTAPFYYGDPDYIAKLNELLAVADALVGPAGPTGPAGPSGTVDATAEFIALKVAAEAARDTAIAQASAAGASATAAASSETTASAQATAASVSSAAAAASATAAAASSNSAATSAATSTAAAAAANAHSSTAGTHASNAAASATAASASATAAAASASAAAASYDSFDDRYLGAKSSNPSVDNDGNSLIVGAIYWNSVSNEMRAYTGSSWVVAYVPAGNIVTTVNTRTGAVVLTNADVGLGNVDNTSDVNKPVSTATQTALNLKSDSTHVHAISGVTGLQTALDGKASITHNHAIADITGLSGSLAALASSAHTHDITEVTGLSTALSGKQDTLISGTNIKTVNGVSILGSGNIVSFSKSRSFFAQGVGA